MNLEFVRPLIKYLPEVKIPKRHVPFREKLWWTALVLVLFFVMGVIYPVGVTPELLQQKISGFSQMQMIFASSIGSITSAGIGPIVTASIILQLLVGAKIIDMDLTKPENKALFQGAQKILTIIVAFFEAAALVMGIHMVEGTALITFTIFQIALGSILLMYMDEVVSKWGIGSGIGLFIAGGVSQHIITGSLNFMKSTGGIAYAGYIPNFIDQLANGSFNLVLLFPVIATIIVFLVTVYCESMRIEIPLSFGGIRGVGGRYPIKFFYVSNIPVILAAALLMNVQMWTKFAGVDLYAPPTQMTFFQNLVYQLGRHITMGELNGIINPADVYRLLDVSVLFHLLTYLIAFVGLCILFGKFWVTTTGLDAGSIANQIQEGGMQIPGFRRDKRIVERVLNRYIPQITILSSVAVGLLAAGADLLGALGSGTGILLTVGIIYRLYEEIQREEMADMSPAFRRFVGKE